MLKKYFIITLLNIHQIILRKINSTHQFPSILIDQILIQFFIFRNLSFSFFHIDFIRQIKNYKNNSSSIILIYSANDARFFDYRKTCTILLISLCNEYIYDVSYCKFRAFPNNRYTHRVNRNLVLFD